jgi:DMSO/TMAO reductase YedYZ heme-binding membrane subunit
MSVGYQAVQSTRQKLIYDAILMAGVALYLAIYLIVVYRLDPPRDLPAAIDLRIRAFGTCAFFMLTIILSIGPLARLSPRFLPLLYNRRHFGVLTFLVALAHVWFMLEWYAVQNALPNLYVELTKLEDYGKFIGFPFKALGIAALLILFVMAATSHDFWLVFLTPPVWKALHMGLYAAYGLVVMHVALGIMQSDRNPLIPAMLVAGFAILTVLHLVAAWRERAGDRGVTVTTDGWLPVGLPLSIPDQGARIVAAPGGERIAVSVTARRSARSRISARTRMARSGRDASSTAASPARGTATNTGLRTAARRRRSPRSSSPTGCGSQAAWSRSTPSRCRPARQRR